MKVKSLGFILLMGGVLLGCNSNVSVPSPADVFDWQGHRGARGLFPENTIPAFLKALEFTEIQTLELDLAVSEDSQLIVSHEPWFSSSICLSPSGDTLSNDLSQRQLIFQHSTIDVQKFDCGSKKNVNFPEQELIPTYKPTLEEVIQAVRNYCEMNQRDLPNFNIEIKSQPDWDNLYTPSVDVFVDLVIKSLDRLNIRSHTNIQSFDVRPLQLIHELDSTIPLSYLVADKKSLSAYIEDLGFTPRIISPYYKVLDETLIASAKDAGMKIIPWTVNETAEMEKVKEMGVDGIITDYPSKIPE